MKKPPIVSNNLNSANGTSLCGYVKATYSELVEKLGEPLRDFSGDGKVTCEWVLDFQDSTIATIYDYKTGTTPTNLYKWHIGGRGIDVVEKTGKFLNLQTSRNFWE